MPGGSGGGQKSRTPPMEGRVRLEGPNPCLERGGWVDGAVRGASFDKAEVLELRGDGAEAVLP